MFAAFQLGLGAVCCMIILAWGTHATHRATPSGLGSSHEVARIRRHLERAEAMLLSRDLEAMSPARRAARAGHIAALRAYRLRGVFPHNHRRNDRRTPVFVDEHGTRCAMAFLIERSGEADLVSRVASTRNLARIRELADDPTLVAWIDRNGLTLDEAAGIQPEYGGSVDSGSNSTTVAVVLGAGVGLTGVGLNLSIGRSQDARNARGLLGVLCGLVGGGLGAVGLSGSDGQRVLGGIDIGLGLASLGLGVRQLNTPGESHSRVSGRQFTPAIWHDRDGMRRAALIMRF